MAKTKTRPVGRTPVKRTACSVWLKQQFAGGPGRARTIQEAGAKFGWGWATIRNAKKNLNIRSLRQGDQWWWFDPETYTPAAPKSPWPLKNAERKNTEELRARPQVPATGVADPPRLAQGTATVGERPYDFASWKPTSAHSTVEPNRSVEHVKRAVAAAGPTQSPPQSREPETPKPAAPLKPRRFFVWENEVKERRDAVISAAGFADLYVMRADIRLRQEQLHKKGLLQEEAALNDLLSRVNEALEKKKRDEKIDMNQ